MNNLKEKTSSKKWKKIAIAVSIIIGAFVVAVILFISTIAKYLVEKYDVKYSGREIEMDWAYVNPFTGYIHLSNLKILELNSDSIFFSADGVSAKFSMSKLLFKTYEISSITLDHPRGVIIQNKERLNFSDLIEKFTPKETRDSLKAPVHFNIKNIVIYDGEFKYVEQLIPINYSIVKVDIRSSGIFWNTDSINVKFSFQPQTGSGDIEGDLMLNLDNLRYRLALITHKLDMGIIQQYLNDLADYSSFSANLDMNVIASGNLKDSVDIAITGKMALNDFHFGKTPDDDYISFEKLSLGIRELAPANKRFFFDTVMLVRPYFKYELYDSLDNVQRMFGAGGENVADASADSEKFNLIIEIARSIKTLFQNFLSSDYNINRLSVENGEIKFNDYSTNEIFSAELNPFSIKADSVDNTKEWVKVSFESGIKPYGDINASVSMRPSDNKDFDFNYKLKKIPAAAFNPYLITYTSYPLDRGVIDMTGTWNVRNDIIKSTNHLILVDPRFTKKVKIKNSQSLPMPLIMAFVRERGNVIDYEIPISGDISDPKFRLSDVLIDLLGNIFIKPVTTPYRMEVKQMENEIEKILSLNWKMRQSHLSEEQEKFINKISNFLKDNPAEKITIQPYNYSEKEKEYILLFEAKKKYWLTHKSENRNSMTDDDSLQIEKMSSKDASFMKYITENANDTMLFTLQEKCYRLVGPEIVNRKSEQLLNARKLVFMNYFKNNDTEKQVNYLAVENTIPFNGFSYFKINYPGEIPEVLMNAYEQLNEMNNKAPREKYREFRKSKERLSENKLTN